MPYFDNENVSIHYRVDGADQAPPLVLVNSIGTELSVWNTLVADLGRQYRVLRFDLRGQGQSSVPEQDYTVEQLALDLAALLDSQGIVSSHVCGVSLGAMVAVQLAVSAPQRVRSLTLCNTAAYLGPPEPWNARIAATREKGMATVRGAVLERWLSADYVATNPEGAAHLVDMALASPKAGFLGASAALRDVDLRGVLGAVKCPTLVVSSTADVATPPAEGKAIAAAIDGSRYVELPGGHLSHVEQPQLLARSINAFLASI
ncbi:3-oxoadipate enol-lactonase [Massilia dura]|uniref:3-oxoadipate enol-lactonase n=1 Tax=Pseudoduganella dura TaxID=321982 RepID=A0A6I3X5B9_9BURK|nr:3-oxoadipate enol-lactonase [Pseudoduganella dura]MUI11387.1 3-oxoadipate enol-lactonase [Pseudoduganella dura]GGX95840.1 3-oxoadipate enol-lactonase [Pseudoduganella dura]